MGAKGFSSRNLLEVCCVHVFDVCVRVIVSVFDNIDNIECQSKKTKKTHDTHYAIKQLKAFTLQNSTQEHERNLFLYQLISVKCLLH
jgi:hypothetical protein